MIDIDRPSSRPIEALERELKFVLPAGRARAARRWLETLCMPDPEFSSADVWTIYYDTPGWASLAEKLNSDYLKSKIRVRWYAEPGRTPSGPAFLEAKLRTGTKRDKLRVPLPLRADDLWRLTLDATALRDLPQRLLSLGVRVEGSWTPMVQLRYRRDRFIERTSGSRIAFDSDIRIVRVNQRHLALADPRALPVAVLEVKGYADQLPARLEPLLRLGSRKQTFSKYAAVWTHARRASH